MIIKNLKKGWWFEFRFMGGRKIWVSVDKDWWRFLSRAHLKFRRVEWGTFIALFFVHAVIRTNSPRDGKVLK